MKIQNLLAAGSVLAACAFGAASATAGPIPLGDTGGPVTIKFSDFESFTGVPLAVGSQNYGIFEITSVEDDSDGSFPYGITGPASASAPLYIGVFSGITVTSNSGGITQNTGGVFSVYQVTGVAGLANFTTQIAAQGTGGYGAAGCLVDTQCYNGVTNEGYTDVLNFSLVPGATSNDVASTLQGTITSTSPVTGSATGFGDITGGADAGEFLPGQYTTAAGTPADISIQDDFCSNAQSTCTGHNGTNWQLASEDPIGAFAVPEPGSLALIGSQLIGLGAFFGWRRKRRGAQAEAA